MPDNNALKNHRLHVMQGVLAWEGELGNSRVRELFDVQLIQASRLLADLKKKLGDQVMVAGGRARAIRPAAPEIFPATMSLAEYSRVTGQADQDQETIEEARLDFTNVTPNLFATLRQAVITQSGVEIRYASMSNPVPAPRIIFPHVLVHVGRRWHVSNTQKIILKRQHKEKNSVDKLFGATGEKLATSGVYAEAADLYNFDQPEEEGELTTNQRFEKLRRLEQLGIYVDEAHHAFGKTLAKDMGVGAKETDTSLRTTIDVLAASLSAAGTRVVACYNYTGTPYVGREVLPEVVYAYGLKEAIDKGFLKKVTLHGYANTRTEEFVDIAIESFLKETEGLRPEGLSPKLAFFAATIDELTSELRPAVERALLKHGIPTSRILVNVGDDKLTTNDDIREFNRLDTEGSEKQFILLVNKGREGWNCRSLFGVGLFRDERESRTHWWASVVNDELGIWIANFTPLVRSNADERP